MSPRSRPLIEPLYLAELTLPEGHPLAGERCPVLAFVIRHPDGAILVDTGVGTHEGIARLYRPAGRPLAEALGAADLRAGDIVAVVNTHLHFDHCGENALFPGVPIYVQRAEHEAAQEALYTVREYVDAAGVRYEHVDGEREIAEGVRLVPTPGHTPGHQSVAAEGEGERAVIAGQAVYTAEELAGPATSRAGEWDIDQYAASVGRLRELEPADVHFSHDDTIWRAAEHE